MMTPDVEELIKRVNTLTVDKNRLRHKLTQITNQNSGNNQYSPKESQSSFILTQSSPTSINSNDQILQNQDSSQSSGDFNSIRSKTSSIVNNATATTNNINSCSSSCSGSGTKSSSLASSNSLNINQNNKLASSNLIAGVECSTSCEDDLLFMNELYRKRLDEYNDNWSYIQSKCTALLSELSALQENYSMLKKEKLDLEEKLRSSCDENDKIKSELQTVVLNYETQLSAMSEHLSMITSQVSLEDAGLARAQPH